MNILLVAAENGVLEGGKVSDVMRDIAPALASLGCQATGLEKNGLNRVKSPLVAGFSVGMTFFMADKFKIVALGKKRHLRYNDGVFARAP